MSYRQALEALEEGKYKDVIKWFDGLPPAQRDGKTCALAALAHFKLEEYKDAEKLYAEAVKAKGKDAADWRKMQAISKANDAAKINDRSAQTALLRRRRPARAPLCARRRPRLPDEPTAHRTVAALNDFAFFWARP